MQEQRVSSISISAFLSVLCVRKTSLGLQGQEGLRSFEKLVWFSHMMTVHFPHLVLAAKELAATTARGPLQRTVHSSYSWLHLLVLLPFTPLSQLFHFVFLYMSLEAATTPISGYRWGINKQERIWTNPLRWRKSAIKA